MGILPDARCRFLTKKSDKQNSKSIKTKEKRYEVERSMHNLNRKVYQV